MNAKIGLMKEQMRLGSVYLELQKYMMITTNIVKKFMRK